MPVRRNFSAEFKAKVVLELISGEKGLIQANSTCLSVQAKVGREKS